MAIITILQQQSRSGNIESLVWKVPEVLRGKSLEIGFIMPLAEMQDLNSNLEIDFYLSNNGVESRHDIGFTWRGGDYKNKGGGNLQNIGIKKKIPVTDDIWLKALVKTANIQNIGLIINTTD